MSDEFEFAPEDFDYSVNPDHCDPATISPDVVEMYLQMPCEHGAAVPENVVEWRQGESVRACEGRRASKQSMQQSLIARHNKHQKIRDELQPQIDACDAELAVSMEALTEISRQIDPDDDDMPFIKYMEHMKCMRQNNKILEKKRRLSNKMAKKLSTTSDCVPDMTKIRRKRMKKEQIEEKQYQNMFDCGLLKENIE